MASSRQTGWKGARRAGRRLLLTGLMLAILGPLSVAEASTWDSLTLDQQNILQPFSDGWDQRPPAQRQRLVAGADLWLAMPAERRRLVHQRFGRWQRMSDDQRARILERFNRFRNLPPEQQRLLRRNFQRFNALPETARRRIRQRWADMTPEQREGFLDRLKTTRSAAPVAATVREQMAPAQAQWFRRLSRQLNPEARRGLQNQLRNGNPQRWNELERRLREMSEAEREAFLTKTQTP